MTNCPIPHSKLTGSRRWSAAALTLLVATAAQGQELDLDLGFAGSTLSNRWGLAAHGQYLFDNGLGFDLGYRYQDELQYDVDGATASHAFSQYETGVIWQEGNAGARFQAIAGMIFAGYQVVDGDGSETLGRFTPGYRLDADISVPLFTRYRVFANGGYQGFYSDGMPNQWRWRYGVRLTLGNEVSPLERDAQARLAREQAELAARRDNPAPHIDPDVPHYMPGHLSQSLPPIVRHSEVCKCFPAGPYTLQLGEFRTMEQAVRAMEYRGLRQFFNTVAYERDPQPVFLAQAEPDGPVSLFVSEFDTVAESEYWRRQLRRNGIEGRLRKVVGGQGRAANETVAVPTADTGTETAYTAQEVERMNSLPGEAKPADTLAMNSTSTEQAPFTDSLVIGPVGEAQVRQWLEQPEYRKALTTPSATSMPGRHRLVWNASRAEGWLYLDGFEQGRQLDQWRAWLEEQGHSPHRHEKARMPIGDVYVYTLGGLPKGYSVQMSSQPSAAAMLALMVSPEVLWFQAYQAINRQPPELVVNWSDSDQRYHLMAAGFADRSAAVAASQNLSQVGLAPSLIE